MLGTEYETNAGDRVEDKCWGPSRRQMLGTDKYWAPTNTGHQVGDECAGPSRDKGWRQSR